MEVQTPECLFSEGTGGPRRHRPISCPSHCGNIVNLFFLISYKFYCPTAWMRSIYCFRKRPTLPKTKVDCSTTRGRQDLRVKFARREKNLLELKAYLQIKLQKCIEITSMTLNFVFFNLSSFFPSSELLGSQTAFLCLHMTLLSIITTFKN